MFFRAEGLTLYYQRLGAGRPPFLLLHGTTGRSDSFNSLTSHLSLQHQLFLPDLRGHGQSSHHPDGYRVADFAADFVPFIEQVIGAATVVLGHSLGGLVGIYLAAHRPDLVQALIVEDAPLWLRRHTVRTGSERAYNFFTTLHQLRLEMPDPNALAWRLAADYPEMLAREGPALASRLAQLDPDVLRMSYDSSLMDDFDLDRSLAAITCPTLLLQADPQSGGSLADADARAALALLTDGGHHFIAGAGHKIHAEQPAFMARLIRDWLPE